MKVLVLVGSFIMANISCAAHSSCLESLDVSCDYNLPEPKIQYLGVGGWLLKWQGEGVLLAPSFSNPALFNHKGWPPLRVEADKQRIDQYMPPAKDVTMLLVGHGHYDHLLDVPWVMRKHTPNAIVYGSGTVVHILHAMRDRNRTEDEHWTWVDPERVKNAEPDMATVPGCEGQQGAAKSGTWIFSRGGHIRTMPVQSMHANHIPGHTFADGGYTEDLTEVPTSVFGWKQGQSMAWLIDLLDENKKIVYRIHFQDSAATPPCGLPPELHDDKAIDVEILSTGLWRNVDNYPDELLKRSKPRLVLLGHWENFFGNDPSSQKPEPVSEQEAVEIRKAVDSVLRATANHAIVRMPAPLSDVSLPAPQ